MSESKRPTTVEEYGAQHLDHAIVAIRDRLRKLAEEIDLGRFALDKVGKPGRESYAGIAADVQSSVLWAVANMNLSGLVMTAFEADRARQRGVAAKTIADEIDIKVEKIRAEADSPSTGMALGAVLAVGADVAREYAAKEA